MPKYISSWKMTLDLEWSDTEDENFYAKTTEVNPEGIRDKDMDWILEGLEQEQNEIEGESKNE